MPDDTIDSTLQSVVAQEATPAPLTESEPAATTRPRPDNKARRTYRTKKSSSDNENSSGEHANEQEQLPQQQKTQHRQSSTETGISVTPATLPSSSSSATTGASTLPYVQSQNAQNLGEVYPGLARLSFLDQEQGADEAAEIDSESHGAASLGLRKSRRPLQQKQPQIHNPETSDGINGKNDADKDVEASTLSPRSAMAVPPTTSPSARSSSAAGSGSSVVEIKETGSAAKGKGVFSAVKDVLKPGTLVFKELGYCQVVNDASLSQVCSACFKDVREELGEDEMASSAGTVPASGQRKLVRCAGCKIVWYCNKTCQIKDWKLHHQLECQGIQKSMTNPIMKEVWTKRNMDTTLIRTLCRLIRRRERVKASAAHKKEHKKIDAAQKQVNEIYFSSLDQKEEEWLDEYGASWIEQYLNTYEGERKAGVAAAASSKGMLEESSQLAKTLAVVMSCVVTPKEDRHAFLTGMDDTGLEVAESSFRAGGFGLLRRLNSYGFAITNLETTTAIGLALYVQCMPFMNHSCVPNCVYTFKGSRVECRVIRDIQPGEEMTISYIDQIGTTRERQRQLTAQYQFVCECPLCQYFPANPLVEPEQDALKDLVGKPMFQPILDPKQGFICPSSTCEGVSGGHPILAVESQLDIYNNVKLLCSDCGHTVDLTQEIVQENEEVVERLISGFVHEMNGGSSTASTSKATSRNFELARVQTPVESSDKNTDGAMTTQKPKAIVGGLATVGEPSARALQSFREAYTALTRVLPTGLRSGRHGSDTVGDSVCHSPLHRHVRRLEQAGFDEAVSHKNWVFALHRSIELERILNETYVGHHPLKAIQGYYTCKIANLLANLLLEESTVEIEESEEEKEKDKDEELLESDDENDLKALRDVMHKGGRGGNSTGILASGRSMQEQLLRRKPKGMGEGSLKESNSIVLQEEGNEEDRRRSRRAQGKDQKKQIQADSSRQLLQYLKSLIPKFEDARMLEQFRVCWGRDGKLAGRYLHQIDSLKQALHYAELPFAAKQ